MAELKKKNLKIEVEKKSEDVTPEIESLKEIDHHKAELTTAGAAKDEYNVEILEDNTKIDILYLDKKDPNFVYRWLRDDPKNISLKTSNLLKQGGGWQLVPRSHLINLGYSPTNYSQDGLMRRGEMILSRMPKHLYEKKLADKKKKADAPMDMIKRRIEGGQPVDEEVHPSMKGLQTEKQLNIK